MFRVYDKWFAVIPLNDTELKVYAKCDPDEAIELRERYVSVSPAWHFNKKYWNSIVLNDDMKDQSVKQWILHSVDEVIFIDIFVPQRNNVFGLIPFAK